VPAVCITLACDYLDLRSLATLGSVARVWRHTYVGRDALRRVLWRFLERLQTVDHWAASDASFGGSVLPPPLDGALWAHSGGDGRALARAALAERDPDARCHAPTAAAPRFGDTLLVWAARVGWTELVWLLLRCGADPNLDVSRVDAAGGPAHSKRLARRTALYAAPWTYHPQCFELLLRYGARPDAIETALGTFAAFVNEFVKREPARGAHLLAVAARCAVAVAL
jgi:hypothetical protein